MRTPGLGSGYSKTAQAVLATLSLLHPGARAGYITIPPSTTKTCPVM